MIRKQDALDYHRSGRPGKIEVVPTKPLRHASATCRSRTRPASPSRASRSRRTPSSAWEYTARGNLVAVITNGTAVLGPRRHRPARRQAGDGGQGRACSRSSPTSTSSTSSSTRPTSTRFVDTVAALEPTFGGINLEDIKAPECFEIEDGLRERMQIPVFHDDQHGTAIISGAALLNARRARGQEARPTCKVVVSGAGAAAIACANFFVELGVRRENIMLVDSERRHLRRAATRA